MAFYKTKQFKYFQNLIFGIGAAIVMIGAASKITHQAILGIDGNIWILLGLGTEALLFAFSGIIPPHEDYYWQKLYPGLDEYDGSVEGATALSSSGNNASSLDQMLENAKIDQDAINRLGTNLKSLGDNVSQLGAVANTTVATDSFARNAEEAANALSSVKGAYSNAADAMGKLASASEDTGKYHEQVQIVTKNLASLNAMYEMELQDADTHLKAMNKFYGNISTAMSHLDNSLEDAEKYRSQMAKLATNLEQLNSVYGNMLTAMRS